VSRVRRARPSGRPFSDTLELSDRLPACHELGSVWLLAGLRGPGLEQEIREL